MKTPEELKSEIIALHSISKIYYNFKRIAVFKCKVIGEEHIFNLAIHSPIFTSKSGCSLFTHGPIVNQPYIFELSDGRFLLLLDLVEFIDTADIKEEGYITLTNAVKIGRATYKEDLLTWPLTVKDYHQIRLQLEQVNSPVKTILSENLDTIFVMDIGPSIKEMKRLVVGEDITSSNKDVLLSLLDELRYKLNYKKLINPVPFYDRVPTIYDAVTFDGIEKLISRIKSYPLIIKNNKWSIYVDSTSADVNLDTLVIDAINNALLGLPFGNDVTEGFDGHVNEIIKRAVSEITSYNPTTN